MRYTFSLVWHFAVHILIGTVLFCLLAAAATFVDYFSNKAMALGTPPWIGVVCHGVAALLFVIDVVCVCFYLLIQGFKMLKRIWEDRDRDESAADRTL